MDPDKIFGIDKNDYKDAGIAELYISTEDGRKIIGIIGTRRRDTQRDYEIVEKQFLAIYQEGDIIVSGGCKKGGDRFAEIIAKKYGLTIITHYPNWTRYGKGAGFVRNGKIAKDADKLIACVATDRTGGTEDTVKKFIKAKPENELLLV